MEISTFIQQGTGLLEILEVMSEFKRLLVTYCEDRDHGEIRNSCGRIVGGIFEPMPISNPSGMLFGGNGSKRSQ